MTGGEQEDNQQVPTGAEAESANPPSMPEPARVFNVPAAVPLRPRPRPRNARRRLSLDEILVSEAAAVPVPGAAALPNEGASAGPVHRVPVVPCAALFLAGAPMVRRQALPPPVAAVRYVQRLNRQAAATAASPPAALAAAAAANAVRAGPAHAFVPAPAPAPAPQQAARHRTPPPPAHVFVAPNAPARRRAWMKPRRMLRPRCLEHAFSQSFPVGG